MCSSARIDGESLTQTRQRITYYDGRYPGFENVTAKKRDAQDANIRPYQGQRIS